MNMKLLSVVTPPYIYQLLWFILLLYIQSNVPMPSNVPVQDDSCAPQTPLLSLPRQFPPWAYTTLTVPWMICTYLYYLDPLSHFYLESCTGLREFSEPLIHFLYTFPILLRYSSRLSPWSFSHTYLSHRNRIRNWLWETSLPFRTLRCWTFPWYFLQWILVSLDFHP